MSKNRRPINPRHTKTCASGDCPCFAEGKQAIRTELAEIRDELMAAMQRIGALLDQGGTTAVVTLLLALVLSLAGLVWWAGERDRETIDRLTTTTTGADPDVEVSSVAIERLPSGELVITNPPEAPIWDGE
jgi:hypothetical protein